MPVESGGQEHAADRVAYLVVLEGMSWGDVFRLTPGQVTTVGRAPTNRIVIRDEICSRNHCEVFQTRSRWTLRDLGSRNGTLINGERVSGDAPLEQGDVVQIGSCELGFTFDLSRPFEHFEDRQSLTDDTETSLDLVLDRSTEEEIKHRRKKHRFRAAGRPESLGRDRTSRELARLYRLGLDMADAKDRKRLSEVVLEALLEGSSADVGAVLLLPEDAGETRPGQLAVVACQSRSELPYQKVSDYLAGVVMHDREAVLADVNDNSRLSMRDERGEIHATSVICAPIAAGGALRGLMHLYSTDRQRSLVPDDLEFTLAVADQMAVRLADLTEKETLVDGLARVRDENLSLRRQLKLESELVGDSPMMQELREKIARIASTEATVLIRGESGVGKELVARSIHFNSPRRSGPFVCMNCAALSESLLESELFGHEKGSFTGAAGRKIGKFEQAHEGSLFLDEVGEIGLGVQAKFLRVLEGHPFERVGGGKPIKVDVRVIAATNRDLEKAVAEGAFRKDLYFRLHVVELRAAPLREHPSDIPLLANHFLERFAAKTRRPVERFSPDALEALMSYRWPGNVRELQNAVERAVILCPGRIIRREDIQLSDFGGDDVASHQRSDETAFGDGYREISLEVLEQEHILATLEQTNWNKTKTAQILGIERSTLDRKLKRYGVSRPQQHSPSRGE